MAIRYTTVARAAKVEQSIERSRFIGHISSALSREEAEFFINKIRAEHRDATHNVPCFVLGEKQELQWASDDGEPQGTAGGPMLRLLVKKGVSNVVLVVTRYFGGIKLGTGGLARAYGGTASMALEAAGLRTARDMTELRVRLGYNLLGGLKKAEKSLPFEISDIMYGSLVEAVLEYESEFSDGIKGMLSELSGGGAEYLSEKNYIR